jgi:hypothetical protein
MSPLRVPQTSERISHVIEEEENIDSNRNNQYIDTATADLDHKLSGLLKLKVVMNQNSSTSSSTKNPNQAVHN